VKEGEREREREREKARKEITIFYRARVIISVLGRLKTKENDAPHKRRKKRPSAFRELRRESSKTQLITVFSFDMLYGALLARRSCKSRNSVQKWQDLRRFRLPAAVREHRRKS